MATFDGTYGRSKTETTIYEHEGWYVAHGSVNVNRTMDTIEDGVDIEELEDFDCFTADKPIESEEELIEAIYS